MKPNGERDVSQLTQSVRYPSWDSDTWSEQDFLRRIVALLKADGEATRQYFCALRYHLSNATTGERPLPRFSRFWFDVGVLYTDKSGRYDRIRSLMDESMTLALLEEPEFVRALSDTGAPEWSVGSATKTKRH
jgi:hypothetical protein